MGHPFADELLQEVLDLLNPGVAGRLPFDEGSGVIGRRVFH
jgi:hypothetical protein